MGFRFFVFVGLIIVAVFIISAALVNYKSHPNVLGVNTGKVFYSKDIKSHNSSSNCWTVIGDRVYNLTSFISRHPGGEEAILNLCGKDATKIFGSQHGGEPLPQMELNNLHIGIFK